MTIAEEPTAWPGVSPPAADRGLGFDMKWNMGWTHDTLDHFARDPLYRRRHQGQLTFSIVYAFHENFVLPPLHDEVVYGKGSLLGKMPGDDWQQFANLRVPYGYFWTHPGKKLSLMGGGIGQRREWTHEGALDGGLESAPAHAGVTRLVADLNRLDRDEPSLHAHDFDAAGFEWVAIDDAVASVVAYPRQSDAGPPLRGVCNLTPQPRHDDAVGVPEAGRWSNE